MQRIVQTVAGRGLLVVMSACALVGCAESVPVVTTPSAVAGSAGTSSQPPVSTSTPAPLSLEGTPASSVVAGALYAFQPTASQSATPVTFSITNRPTWATFSASTGELHGTAPVTSVGTSANITITASNGASLASLGPFDITVTAPPTPPTSSVTAVLTWVAPTMNTDGSPLTDAAGYHIYYGKNAAQLNVEVILKDAAATRYVVDGLTTGVYYFAITAFSTEGTESMLSNVVSKKF